MNAPPTFTPQQLAEVRRLQALYPDKRGALHEVVTFYTLYFQQPKGRHIVAVCHNLSCHLAGAQDILRHLESRLGIQRGETTDDGRVTLQAVECLCACEAAPMAQVDDRYELNLTREKVDRLLESLA